MIGIKIKLPHYLEPIDPKLAQHDEAATTESEYDGYLWLALHTLDDEAAIICKPEKKIEVLHF